MEESLRTYIAHKNISFDIDEFLGFLKQNRSRKQKEELKIS
jgi:hypothetical protein